MMSQSRSISINLWQSGFRILPEIHRYRSRVERVLLDCWIHGSGGREGKIPVVMVDGGGRRSKGSGLSSILCPSFMNKHPKTR